MNGLKLSGIIKFVLACFLIFTNAIGVVAQYRGAPVKKERLIKALRSKLLQTSDIVTVINSNGVDFVLTEETEKLLVAAGARPEVIRAVANNFRADTNLVRNNARRTNRNAKTTYDDLIELAMISFRERKDANNAVRYLKTAVKLEPNSPAAYQMLGFVNLYGLNNAVEAEKLMRQAIENGGSAVFRVFHDDSGGFSTRCTGSLYISPDKIRFESDDNRHTFETSIGNVDKFRLDTESNRSWKKHTVFNIVMKIGKEDIKFRFAPITGRKSESEMVERFVFSSKNAVTVANVAEN